MTRAGKRRLITQTGFHMGMKEGQPRAYKQSTLAGVSYMAYASERVVSHVPAPAWKEGSGSKTCHALHKEMHGFLKHQ